MPVLDRLSTLPGSRRLLLAGTALLVISAALPWYRIEGRGFVVEYSGWHDLGVLAWILAIDLLGWELLRIFGLAPVDGDRGDRFSAFGGLCLATVAGIFVLQRLADGGLGSGWFVGAAMAVVVGATSLRLFSEAHGPQAIAAAVGRGEPPPDGALPARRSGAEVLPSRRTGAEGGGSPGGASWRREDRPTGRPPAPAPGRRAPSGRPRRPHPEEHDQGPPPGGWPKTLAERQRDAPPLWADRDDRPGRSL